MFLIANTEFQLHYNLSRLLLRRPLFIELSVKWFYGEMSFPDGTQNPWLKPLLLSKRGASHFPAISGAKEPLLNHTLEQGASWHPCFLLSIKRDSGKEGDFFPMQPWCPQQRELCGKLGGRKVQNILKSWLLELGHIYFI